MKNLSRLLFFLLLFTIVFQAQSQKGFSLKPSQKSLNLPALQSFVFAKSGNYWLLVGGRTNGFHGFGSATNFPFKKANKFIYVYNTATNKLDSMAAANLPAILREQYTSSNMQHFQVGNYLYISGGYGEFHAKLPDSTWTTYSTISRINISSMLNAIITKNNAQFMASVVYAKDPITASTGGEMYKLPDGKFYLVLGHRFMGMYNASFTNPKIQTYLDSVHVFKLAETPTSISIINSSRQYISDNKPDSVTQFRRRDLLVVPTILKGGQSVGLTVYGGVFTYGNNGVPFRNPIYLKGGTIPNYQVDYSYTQTSNIYATANTTMYDAPNDVMLTTAFGGIGTNATADNDDFTKSIITISKNNKTNITTEINNPTGTPTFMGSESIFITAPSVPKYNSQYDIINYAALPVGKKTLIGYIYGGIVSNSPVWSFSNPTVPTNMVYEVYYTK
jgi:hypothetical protein